MIKLGNFNYVCHINNFMLCLSLCQIHSITSSLVQRRSPGTMQRVVWDIGWLEARAGGANSQGIYYNGIH